ncbi:hypothetical protein [Mucilaginibacter sp.]|uniref:hypothetical protein n=1 Tax=Mucilaginibacter sp. TaxID=1882438 RepID=UPI0035BBD335
MTTLTIEISDKAGKTLADLAKQLGGKVTVIDSNQKQSKAIKKKQILNDLEESAKFVKLYQEDKIDAKSIEQLLNEL